MHRQGAFRLFKTLASSLNRIKLLTDRPQLCLPVRRRQLVGEIRRLDPVNNLPHRRIRPRLVPVYVLDMGIAGAVLPRQILREVYRQRAAVRRTYAPLMLWWRCIP